MRHRVEDDQGGFRQLQGKNLSPPCKSTPSSATSCSRRQCRPCREAWTTSRINKRKARIKRSGPSYIYSAQSRQNTLRHAQLDIGRLFPLCSLREDLRG